MPGIADNPTTAINTAPLAAIGSDQPVPPALNDFMQAFRSGFITVDDLTRRTKQSAIDTSNMQTTLSANDLQRRKTGAELQLLPGQTAEAQTQQQIQAASAPGRIADAQTQTKMSQEQAERFARYQADSEKFIADEMDEKARRLYIEAKGPLPSVFMVPNPEKRPPFSEWAGAPLAEAAERGDSVAEDRLLEEYRRRFPAKIAARKGTPEYAAALRDEVDDIADKSLIRGARAKALPGILEKQAVGGAPHNSKVTRVNPATGLEEEVLIQTDSQNGEFLGETVLAKGTPKLTEAQGRAQLFATRMSENDQTLTTLEQSGFDPASIGSTAQKFLPNRLRSTDFQQYTAAKDNWISAVLRQESGAAISPSEYAQANKEYFPRDGDDSAVVTQKQRLRKVAEERMRAVAGPGIPATVAAPATTGSAVPSAGAKRVIQNGVTFEWNGTTYVPIP